MSTQYVYLNGEFVPQQEATISVFDMGCLFGAGIYDVCYVYDGKVFQFDAHLNRIRLCTSQIGLTLPSENEVIKTKGIELVEKNNLKYGYLYMQATFGGKIGVRTTIFANQKLRPKDLPYTFFMFTIPMENMQPEAFKKGAKTHLEPDRRWRKAQLKSTSLIANVLAGSEAAAEGFVEAIMFDDEKNVVLEGSATNVFCVKDGIVHTHPLEENPDDFGRVLHGVTRGIVVDLCKKHNIPLKETEFSVEFLLNCDEAFLTSTTKEILPIVKIDDKVIGDGKPGKISETLEKHYVELVESECGIIHPKRVLFN